MKKSIKRAIKNGGDDLHKILGEAWLGIRVKDESLLYNPLLEIPSYCEEKPELFVTWLMSRPEYFSFICKEIFGIQLLPIQALMLQLMWKYKFPMLIGSRGLGKSFILALYILLRIFFLRNRKVVIAGAGFRQSKVIFNYIETIINNSPILKDIVFSQGLKSPLTHSADEYKITIADSYAIAIPIGDGQKIRGKRANDIIADEFASMVIEIFETVIAGFAAVSAAPVDAVRQRAIEHYAKKWGIDFQEIENMIELDKTIDNQIIISGTAYYDFNHFSKYHKRWLSIIKSRGDRGRLSEIFGQDIPESFNWKDYCVMRVPYELAPVGFLDDAQIARSRATMHAGNYEMEFGAVFSLDSDGFFKRSLLEACVVNEQMILGRKDGTTGTYAKSEIFFEPMMYGNLKKRYVIGVDPASKVDNFAVVVLEIQNEIRKIVHVWTTNEKDHRAKLENGTIKEHNFYAYTARKIRELMKKFPCDALAIDSEGGGRAVMEALADKDKIAQDELPILHIIDPNEPRLEDGQQGLHIIHEIHFADLAWTANANHGMKKDFEDRVLLFPFIDPISLSLAAFDDEEKQRYSDTLQQCIKDIEELKNELSSIIITETATGKERWDTPETKTGTGKKARSRKDRYSALLMANMVARTIYKNPEFKVEFYGGGFVGQSVKKQENNGQMYVGPSWLVNKLGDLYK